MHQNLIQSQALHEAIRKTKDQNGIPRSQQPDKTIKAGASKGDKANLGSNESIKLYEYRPEYTISKGKIKYDKINIVY